MIVEYRFRAYNPQGKLVQGNFSVRSKKEAKAYIAKLTEKFQLRIDLLEKKKDFLYTIKNPGRKPLKGRQSAFSKEEVESALKKMGYTNYKVNPVLFDLPIKPASQDILMFIKLSTNMLKDKMSFGRVLSMLAEEQTNQTLKNALIQIENQLKGGAEGKDVFSQYEHVFGRFPAFMLGLATKSGNMTEIFEATTKFIERDEEIKKNIKKALISPMFAVVATLLAVMYYIVKIFPATAELFLSYDMDLPPMTMATLDLSHLLGRIWWLIIILIATPIIIIWRWWSTPSGRVWRDQQMVKLPLIGHLIHKSSIEIYFRVFGTIYAGAGDNIETIRTAAEACRNAWMEKNIKTKTIPLMLREGEGFVPAMEASGVFNRTTITRLKTGQETGNILQAAQQICSFYEAETTYKMNALVEYIQTIVALFITLAITFLTIVSAEIATISPPTAM